MEVISSLKRAKLRILPEAFIIQETKFQVPIQ